MEPLPVQAVCVSDGTGQRRARCTPEQFEHWIRFANHAFRDAGIEFAFDPSENWDELRDTAINDMVGAGAPGWPETKRACNQHAARLPGRLVVFLRHGPGPTPSGAAFAGVDLDFLVLGGFEDMSHCGHPHLDVLAHEIGHHLGLPHTFVGEPFADIHEAEAHLLAHGGDPSAFDGDGFSDTPPDPAIRTLECARQADVSLNGQRFPLPRRNLMSYYDERDSLTPQQIERVQWVLQRRLKHAMCLPANRPGPNPLDASRLRVIEARDCSSSTQSMQGFGVNSWSGDVQLFCGAQPGAALTLELPVPESGVWDLDLYATLAPDFGVLDCRVNETVLTSGLDFYAPLVLPTGPIPLGRVELPAGPQRIAFQVTSKHPASSGHHFGLDALEWRKVSGPKSLHSS